MKMINAFVPLTPAVFYILFALASGEKHGYEIMKQVKQDSQPDQNGNRHALWLAQTNARRWANRGGGRETRSHALG